MRTTVAFAVPKHNCTGERPMLLATNQVFDNSGGPKRDMYLCLANLWSSTLCLLPVCPRTTHMYVDALTNHVTCWSISHDREEHTHSTTKQNQSRMYMCACCRWSVAGHRRFLTQKNLLSEPLFCIRKWGFSSWLPPDDERPEREWSLTTIILSLKLRLLTSSTPESETHGRLS
jgi:hypothetical protein